jgi:hypothetical protein
MIPNLFPSPPRGASETTPNPLVPSLELNAEALRRLEQRQVEHERFLSQKANEEQKKLFQDAEEQVLRLQYALRVEAEGHYASAADYATAAEMKLASVEQIANEQLAFAQERIASEAAERQALTERAQQAVNEARIMADAARSST